jgi:hypothetical protein
MDANGSIDGQLSPAETLATAVSRDHFDTKTLLDVLARDAQGDFSVRMPLDWTGLAGKAADGINTVILANDALETELARISRVVGKEGELSQRVRLAGPSKWAGSIESINGLIDALVRPTSQMQRVIGRSQTGT